MTVERTIFLFKNDILRTIEDTRRKMNVLFDGDADKIREEIDFRLKTIWGVSLADMGM